MSHRDSGGDDGPKTAPRGVPVQAVGHCSLAWNEPTENDSIDQMKGLFIILSPVITVVLRQRRLPSYQFAKCAGRRFESQANINPPISSNENTARLL